MDAGSSRWPPGAGAPLPASSSRGQRYSQQPPTESSRGGDASQTHLASANRDNDWTPIVRAQGGVFAGRYMSYRLEVAQEPMLGRRKTDKDRRAIAPAPIVRLWLRETDSLDSTSPWSQVDISGIEASNFICSADLHNPDLQGRAQGDSLFTTEPLPRAGPSSSMSNLLNPSPVDSHLDNTPFSSGSPSSTTSPYPGHSRAAHTPTMPLLSPSQMLSTYPPGSRYHIPMYSQSISTSSAASSPSLAPPHGPSQSSFPFPETASSSYRRRSSVTHGSVVASSHATSSAHTVVPRDGQGSRHHMNRRSSSSPPASGSHPSSSRRRDAHGVDGADGDEWERSNQASRWSRDTESRSSGHPRHVSASSSSRRPRWATAASASVGATSDSDEGQDGPPSIIASGSRPTSRGSDKPRGRSGRGGTARSEPLSASSDARPTHGSRSRGGQISERNLHGNLHVSGTKVPDQEGVIGIWFLFTDLCIRNEGKYTLRLRCFDITSVRGDMEIPVPPLVDAWTQSFRVYSPRNFPGLPKPTALAGHFASLGYKLNTRKNERQAQGQNSPPSEPEPERPNPRPLQHSSAVDGRGGGAGGNSQTGETTTSSGSSNDQSLPTIHQVADDRNDRTPNASMPLGSAATGRGSGGGGGRGSGGTGSLRAPPPPHGHA